MGQIVKKSVRALLIVCFFITDISPAFAQNQNPIALNPSVFTEMDSDKFMQNPDQLPEEDQANLKKFLTLPTQTTLEILFLLKNLYHRVKVEEERLGTDTVAKIIAKRKDSESIDFEVEGVGKAEPLVINTKRGPLFFTKVRHNGLKMTILLFDKNQIDIEFLEESERLEKLGLLTWDRTLDGLSTEQIKRELDHRKFILKHIRKLYAKMIMSEWNPRLEYMPLHEQVERSNQPEPKPTPPEEIQSRVSDVMNKPISELKQKGWFKELASKSYNTWIDLAQQEKERTKIKPGNDALMVLFYDGQISNAQTQGRTIIKPSIYTFSYWKMYWKSIYEVPLYGVPVWEKNKGIGKLKVLLTGDYLVGWGFGIGLGFLSSLVSAALPSSLPDGLSIAQVGAISLGYSLFFGVFGKTWANFVYRGTEFQRFLKNWGPGVAQSYTYNIFSSESLALFGANGNYDFNALKIHADIAINQSVKNVTKTSMQKIPKLRDKTGEAEGTMKIPYYKIVLPWKHNMQFMEIEATETTIDTLRFFRWLRNQITIENSEARSWEEKFILRFKRDWKITIPWLVRHEYETYIPRKHYENQAIQLITTPVGLLSRFGYMVGPIPVGHLLYIILGPIGEVRHIRYMREYTEKLKNTYGEDHPFTKRFKAELEYETQMWNSMKIANVPYTQHLGYVFVDIPRQILITAKEIGLWAARKVAYYTYESYQLAEKDLQRQRADAEMVREAQEKYRLLMTVQTSDGRPHPEQIHNAIVAKQSQIVGQCALLFR